MQIQISTLVLMGSLIWTTAASANPEQIFHEKYQLQTNAKGHKVIVDNSLLVGNEIEKYTEHYRQLFSFPKFNEDKFSCQGAAYDNPRDLGFLAKIIKKTKEIINVERILSSGKFAKLQEKLSSSTKNEIQKPDFPVVANMTSPGQFKDRLSEKISDKLIGEIIGQIDPTGTLKSIRYFAKGYVNSLENKKLRSQSQLLYFLVTLSPAQMGLTESEVNRALSSIFEARLDLKDDLLKGKKDFNKFGLEQVAAIKKTLQKRLAQQKDLFDGQQLIAMGFATVPVNGKQLTLNLFNSVNRKDSRAALVLDLDCQDYVAKKRMFFESSLAAIDTRVIQIPSLLLRNSKRNLQFRGETLSEAILEIQYLSEGRTDLVSLLRAQAINPLL